MVFSNKKKAKKLQLLHYLSNLTEHVTLIELYCSEIEMLSPLILMRRLELLFDGLIIDRAIEMTYGWMSSSTSRVCIVFWQSELYIGVLRQSFGSSDSSKLTKLNNNIRLLHCNLSAVRNDKQTLHEIA